MNKYDIVGYGQLLVDKIYDDEGDCIKIDGGDTVWNILHNLSMFGEKCYAVATAGKDKYAQIAIQSLQKMGVDISGIELNDDKTNVLHGVLRKNLTSQDISYTNIDPKTNEITVNISHRLPNKMPEALNGKDVIVVLMNLQRENAEFINSIKTNKKVVLDLGHIERLNEVSVEDVKIVLKSVNICQINEQVVQTLMRKLNIENIEELVLQYKIELLIITKGSKGAEFFLQKDKQVVSFDLPSQRIEKVVEPSGAGDMFLSIFIKAYNRYLAQGKDIDEDFIKKTFPIANRMAGKVVTFIGSRGNPMHFKQVLKDSSRSLD